jgi:hypothetical protein
LMRSELQLIERLFKIIYKLYHYVDTNLNFSLTILIYGKKMTA